MCSCARFACSPPLLAGVCGVGVCACAPVSAAPRHSWLGCWGVCVCVPAPLVPRHSWLQCVVSVCVLGLGSRLRPTTPGWGVGVCVCSCPRTACTPPLLAWVLGCVCVCLGSGFSCAPPLLAGVLGCVCVRVPASLVPRHSWQGCALWVCVLVLRVSAAPRHSWLGCWGVCVFVCPLRLYRATPRWVVWCGCVCSGSGFACAPPLLAGVLGCVCVCVPAPLVPRHSWLGCVVCVCVFGLGFRLRPATPGWGVGVCVCSCARSACTPPLLAGVCGVGVCLGFGSGCAPPLLAGVLGCVCVCVPTPLVPRHSWLGCAAWVCVLGVGFRLRPATPGWVVGVCVCLCARSACSPPLLAGVCGVCVCVWPRVSAAPRHSWLGCWGVCVFVCPLRLYPATPGWGLWCWCVCLGSGFGCASPLLAGVLGCVCVRVRAPLVPRHSWLGCAAWVCVLGVGFRLRPATPGWVVGVCVCLCARSACSPPLLAGVCGVCVCVWPRVSAAPRHSWLGCWGVCVFVCPLPLFPATSGWVVWCVCVCLGSGFGCAPPLLAGVLGCVCVRVPAPLVPRHFWLGRWGVRVCAWARVSAAPRHSWLGC